MIAVKNIVFDHHPTLIGPYTSLQGVFQGPIWYYLLGIPTLMMGGDPWGGLALMFLISVLGMLIVYICMTIFFNKTAGIIALLFFAVSPEAVAAATYVWNPHPMWLLIIVYIIIFYQIILGKKKYHMYLWPIISLMFHFETALAFFIMLGTLINMVIFYRKLLFTKYFFIGVLLAGLLFLPQILFDIRHQFLMTKSVVALFRGEDRGLLVYDEKINIIGIAKSHLDSFYYNFQSGFIHTGYVTSFPSLLLILSLVLLLVGKALKVFSKNEQTFINLVLRCVVVSILLMLFYPYPIRYWFLTGFQTFYLLGFSLLLSAYWRYFLGKVLIIIMCLLMIIFSFQRLHAVYTSSDDGGLSKIKGKAGAIDAIYKDAKGKDFNLLIFNPPVYTDAYDYLVWWKSRNQYNYIPGKEKQGTFYLLIEPDSGKPWSYKGWLETVIKNGTILSTKELPSGMIIQKRYESTR